MNQQARAFGPGLTGGIKGEAEAAGGWGNNMLYDVRSKTDRAIALLFQKEVMLYGIVADP